MNDYDPYEERLSAFYLSSAGFASLSDFSSESGDSSLDFSSSTVSSSEDSSAAFSSMSSAASGLSDFACSSR